LKTASQTKEITEFKSSDGKLVMACYARMEELDLSQAKTAPKIGIGRAVYSQWLTDKYPGDNEEVEKKVKNWINNLAAAKQISITLPTTPDYFETPSSKKMTAALTYAQMAADVAVIYGGAGVSKSSSISHYQKQNPNVWVVEGTPCSGTLSGFLRSACKTLDLRVVSSGNTRMEEAILSRLKDTNGLLVVDEAQFLNERAIEMARRLTEMSNIGLALAGNESVYAQLTGNNRRSAEFAQLFSRIGKKVRLTRPTDDDVNAFCTAWGITGKDERKLIHIIAKKPGALRICTKTLRMASMMAKASNSEVSIAHISAAWRDLGGE